MKMTMHPRSWAVALLLLLVLLGLVACGSGETAEPETLPELSGPALIFFYTDG